jgi:hypothetical protein
VGAQEWERIARCDVISLREFPRQRWVPARFHITGEIDFVEEYAQRVRDNPLYDGAVHIVQEGWLAVAANELVGRRLLPANRPLFRFRRRSRSHYEAPGRSFRDGIVHGWNSITDAVNIAYLLGYRRIVLAGVDLYNKEYFWLEPGETRTYEKEGIVAGQPFTSHEQTIDLMARWRAELMRDGVSLEVYNPRSLLAGPLPVFSWGDEPSRGA